MPSVVAVVAVASGTGLQAVFSNLGVSRNITGGDTMNPSVQEVLDAVADGLEQGRGVGTTDAVSRDIYGQRETAFISRTDPDAVAMQSARSRTTASLAGGPDWAVALGALALGLTALARRRRRTPMA